MTVQAAAAGPAFGLIFAEMMPASVREGHLPQPDGEQHPGFT